MKEAQLELGRKIASVAMNVLFTIPFPWIIIMNIKSSRSTGDDPEVFTKILLYNIRFKTATGRGRREN